MGRGATQGIDAPVPQRRTALIAALAGSALVFASLLLGVLVTHGAWRALDLAMAQQLGLVAGQAPHALILLMQAISWSGGGVQRYLMVTLLAAGLWRWWGWRAGTAMALSSLLAAWWSDWLKAEFARPRPAITAHLDWVNNAAYPSGHAMNAALVYLLFILLMPGTAHRGWQAAALLLAALTGLSRIMLGVHWTTDVLGGWMLGAGLALLTWALVLATTQPLPVHAVAAEA